MLEWPLKDFRKAFAEISAKGMAKADWKNRVVWIPKAIKYNPPESPNVVRSWGKQWGMIPQCPLKDEARDAIIKLLIDEKFGKAFKQAFREAFREDIPEGVSKVAQGKSGDPSGNQEQEQKQEQKQERAHRQPSGDPDPLVVCAKDYLNKHPTLVWNQRIEDGLVEIAREKGWAWTESAVEGRITDGDGSPVQTLLRRIRGRDAGHAGKNGAHRERSAVAVHGREDD